VPELDVQFILNGFRLGQFRHTTLAGKEEIEKMPITSKLYQKFLYIWYSRVTSKDPLSFARSLEEPGSKADKYDVVIDLVICNDLVSAEFAAILRLAKKFNGTGRNVRLLTNAKIKSKLLEVDLNKMPNIIIYDDQQSFIREITGKKL
jgi:hypothetical protein